MKFQHSVTILILMLGALFPISYFLYTPNDANGILDVKVGTPIGIGFLTQGDQVPVTVSVTNTSNEDRYFHITYWWRQDQLQGNNQGDLAPPDDVLIKHGDTKVFTHIFTARVADLWWLIVRADGFLNRNHIGYLIEGSSDTTHLVHPSSDYLTVCGIWVSIIGTFFSLTQIITSRKRKKSNYDCQSNPKNSPRKTPSTFLSPYR